MNLRCATPADAAALSALMRLSYARWTELIAMPPTPVPADYAVLLAHPAWEGWAIEAGSGLEAALIFEIQPDRFELFSIAIAPAAAGGGLGHKLLDFAERRARERGYREITLYTNIKMVSNRAFYGRLGYE